ncbi:type II toxin-antitoxin system RelE/ParE family toxin [Ruminococcus gauvreauii]|uniref:type II toxin-antitoxin system RelE/ParE family toxin n=1 Tax=Ruminococcus gauvreauii TaxID=438033 RepID=UPI0039845CD3
MTDIKYDLRYLPLFYEELEEKIIYISEKLKNPQAANTLLDAVEKAILERLPNAESFESYHSLKERKYPYYRIQNRNPLI